MSSPLVLINGNSQVNGLNVTGNSTVTIALASSVGVYNWNMTCIGTDENTTPALVNATLVINHSSNTATFTALETDGYGSALIFSSIINNGIDVNGVLQPSYQVTFGVYVLASNGLRVGAAGETIEGDSIYGWVSKLNKAIRLA